MKLGIIGLGRMGNAIAYRVLQGGHKVIGFDVSQDALNAAQKIGVEIASRIEDVAKKARIIWLMVPIGDPVDSTIAKLLPHLQKGDIVIDGGNSNFHDSVKRSHELQKHDIFFLDCGTSGGLHGRDIGFSLMVGGDKNAYEKIVPLLKGIAAKNGFGYMGPSGAGHYVKMIHNGIEYGLLQAYADGFHVLKKGSYKDLDLEKISAVWNNGSIIRSWLCQLAHEVFEKDQNFENIVGEIQEGGTGKWTIEEAEEKDITLPAIEVALKVRAWSRETGGNYATKLIALLRNKFGGHAVKKK